MEAGTLTPQREVVECLDGQVTAPSANLLTAMPGSSRPKGRRST